MGQAARRTLAKAVFDLINSNPRLADGKLLFSADHGNVLPAALISTDSVGAMQAAMRLQKDKDDNLIQVPMKGLLTPVALNLRARAVRDSEYAVGAGVGEKEPNTVRNTFEVWDHGRLDQKDPKAWYGLANPAFVDGIVVGYLDGNQSPYLEQEQGFVGLRRASVRAGAVGMGHPGEHGQRWCPTALGRPPTRTWTCAASLGNSRAGWDLHSARLSVCCAGCSTAAPALAQLGPDRSHVRISLAVAWQK